MERRASPPARREAACLKFVILSEAKNLLFCPRFVILSKAKNLLFPTPHNSRPSEKRYFTSSTPTIFEAAWNFL